jgi:transmembrane sensor
MPYPSQPESDASASEEEARVEAAIWIARLHDEHRSPHLDARVNAWLAEKEENRRAFERMTGVWESTSVVDRQGRYGRKRARMPWLVDNRWAGPLAASVLLGVTVAALRLWPSNTIVTAIGQQQVRLLPDGTRLMLNTDTQVKILYNDHTRRVELIHGEAWFDVAKRPAWPFVVGVDNREIRALGTSFVVRHDQSQPFSVTLMEGQISVDPGPADTAILQPPRLLAPGQRLSLPSNAPALVLDTPEITRLTAWEAGRVEFEDMPLIDAAAEMNRYNQTRVIVTDARIANLRIGGVFRAGDSEEFVRTMAVALKLRIERGHNEIRLSSTDSRL